MPMIIYCWFCPIADVNGWQFTIGSIRVTQMWPVCVIQWNVSLMRTMHCTATVGHTMLAWLSEIGRRWKNHDIWFVFASNEIEDKLQIHVGAKEINRVLAHREGFILAANNECINYHIQLPFLPWFLHAQLINVSTKAIWLRVMSAE